MHVLCKAQHGSLTDLPLFGEKMAARARTASRSKPLTLKQKIAKAKGLQGHFAAKGDFGAYRRAVNVEALAKANEVRKLAARFRARGDMERAKRAKTLAERIEKGGTLFSSKFDFVASLKSYVRANGSFPTNVNQVVQFLGLNPAMIPPDALSAMQRQFNQTMGHPGAGPGPWGPGGQQPGFGGAKLPPELTALAKAAKEKLAERTPTPEEIKYHDRPLRKRRIDEAKAENIMENRARAKLEEIKGEITFNTQALAFLQAAKNIGGTGFKGFTQQDTGTRITKRLFAEGTAGEGVAPYSYKHPKLRDNKALRDLVRQIPQMKKNLAHACNEYNAFLTGGSEESAFARYDPVMRNDFVDFYKKAMQDANRGNIRIKLALMSPQELSKFIAAEQKKMQAAQQEQQLAA